MFLRAGFDAAYMTYFQCFTQRPHEYIQPIPLFFPQGVKDFSVPVGLDAKVKVDLVVVGSVAVSEKGNQSTCRYQQVPHCY